MPVGRTRALALLFLLALPLLWLSLVAAPALRVDVGVWGDHTYLSGVNAIEQSSTEDYRWTTERAELALPNLSSRYQLLRLRAHGWRPNGEQPPTVALDIAGTSWGSFATAPEMRVYNLLLPRDSAHPSLRVGFTSAVHQEPGGRRLGFALDWLAARAIGATSGPVLWQFGGQALLWALLLGLLWGLALPSSWTLV